MKSVYDRPTLQAAAGSRGNATKELDRSHFPPRAVSRALALCTRSKRHKRQLLFVYSLLYVLYSTCTCW